MRLRLGLSCPTTGVSGLTRRAGARRGMCRDDSDTGWRNGREGAAETSAEQQAPVELVRLTKEQGLSLTGRSGPAEVARMPRRTLRMPSARSRAPRR